LSLAGGVYVAYVFLALIPSVTSGRLVIDEPFLAGGITLNVLREERPVAR
jgi:hypothetical protein